MCLMNWSGVIALAFLLSPLAMMWAWDLLAKLIAARRQARPIARLGR
jgi:hypothetical protein